MKRYKSIFVDIDRTNIKIGGYMSYYFSTKIKGNFDDIVQKTAEALKKEGFGVLTDIDVSAILKKKLNEDFRKYRILGACNPPFAFKALQTEDKIGTMLPCNVIVQEIANEEIEVAAIDPVASMRAIENSDLKGIADQIQEKLMKVINKLKP
jgi:uncharacterized protein (DUF302 family)